MKITIPHHLTIDELSAAFQRLFGELKLHGITSVVCPDFEADFFCDDGKLTLSPKRTLRRGAVYDPVDTNPRTYFEDLDARSHGFVEIIRHPGSPSGTARTAITSPAVFRHSPTAMNIEQEYLALGERWDLNSEELHDLSRYAFAIDSPWALIKLELNDGYSLPGRDRLDIYLRIAAVAKELMGSDDIVAGWLRGPFGMTIQPVRSPLYSLLILDWRAIYIMALSLEALLARRKRQGRTDPSLVAADFDRILYDKEFEEGAPVPVEEAGRYRRHNGPSSRESFTRKTRKQEAFLERLGRHINIVTRPPRNPSGFKDERLDPVPPAPRGHKKGVRS